jgi:hypothetical protein
MTNFDETGGWMGWSKNEFSHKLGAAANGHCPLRFGLSYEI